MVLLPKSRVEGHINNTLTTTNDGTFLCKDEQLSLALQQVVDAWHHASCIPLPTPLRIFNLSPYPALTMTNIMQMNRSEALEDMRRDVLLAMKLSSKQVREIFRLTRGLNNNLWYEYRYGRILSTCFGKIIYNMQHKAGQLSRDVMAMALGAHNVKNVRSMKHNKQKEPHAIAYYEAETGRDVSYGGLYLSSDGKFAASPHGYVKGHGIGQDVLIVVKCPFYIRDLGLYQSAGPNYFVTTNNQGDYILNRATPIGEDYYNQIQGTLHVSNTRLCDLVVWTPRDSGIIRIRREENWWSNNKHLLTDFFKKTFLPHLLSRAYRADLRRNEIYA